MEEEIITSVLCRICFNIGCYKVESHNLLINNENIVLKTLISEISALEVPEPDNNNIPSMLCESCTDQLKQCYLFLQKIRKADEQIVQLFQAVSEEQKSIESSNVEYDYIKCGSSEDNHLSDIEDDDISVQYLDTKDFSEVPVAEEEHIEPIKTEIKPYESNSKKPHLVLTENVTNISSNITRNGSDDDENSTLEPPPKKILKIASEANSFLVTKFVLTEPISLPDYLDPNREDACDNPHSTVNQVRNIDMAAVEVKANEKIEVELDDETNIESPNTMYMCKYCVRAFSTSHHLIMHARKSHVCQFCMEGFQKATDLHKHIKEAHNHFKCTLCKKDFSSNTNLRQHMKRVHNLELPAHVSLLSIKSNDS